MWPHINLEDLLTPATIPRFLNSRGRNPPCIFASMDWDSTELGRVSFVILERRFDVDEEYWIELGTDDLDKYGGVELIMEDDERTTNVTRGLLILGIQRRVLAFLVKACQGILHDKQLDLESLELVPEEPKPPSVPDAKEGDWPSAVDLALESPYLVPQPLLLDRMESLVQGRLDEWKDYAWAMREDPSFFADVLSDWSESFRYPQRP
jgi:hypothetical protein